MDLQNKISILLFLTKYLCIKAQWSDLLPHFHYSRFRSPDVNVVFGSNDNYSPIQRRAEKISFRQAGNPKFPPVLKNTENANPTCGKRYVEHFPPKNTADEPMPKIVGGLLAPYGAYPWTAHIETLNFDGFEHACGGSIISEFFILTAAHCLHGLSFREVRVKVGDSDTEVKDLAEKTFQTDNWTIHPQFQKGGYYNNDIAVLKVKSVHGKGITFNEYISPACLPSERSYYSPGTWCYVSGWGLMESNALYHSNLLRAATVPLIPISICRSKRVYGSKRVQEGMMCAGYLQGNIDACGGDSGGPLVCDVNGIYTLLGVVSWGEECAEKNKPGMYSDVQYYLGFIKRAMERL